MNQPAIFISCVSPEFGQTRSRVAAILQGKPHETESIPLTEYFPFRVH